MDAKASDKSRLPSRHAAEGLSRALPGLACIAIAGNTPARNLANVKLDENQKVVLVISEAISAVRGRHVWWWKG